MPHQQKAVGESQTDEYQGCKCPQIGAERLRGPCHQPPKEAFTGALRVCSAIFDLTCSLRGVISLCQESPELQGLKAKKQQA